MNKNKPEQFADHLMAVVFKNESLKKDINIRGQMFSEFVQHLSLDFSLVRRFGSATMMRDMDQGNFSWWHAFTDHMAQGLMSVMVDPRTSDLLRDVQQNSFLKVINTSEWNLRTFKNLFGISTASSPTLDYPAAKADIPDLAAFLAYQENTLLPAMKLCACQCFGWTEEQLAEKLIRMTAYETMHMKTEEQGSICIFIPEGNHPVREDFLIPLMA